jgi:hypothetical protein
MIFKDAPLWWLSFCDPDRPEGQRFLGVSIVPGFDIVTAASAARVLGCNPGGEVAGIEIPAENSVRIPGRYVGRLMSRAECDELDLVLLGNG